MDKNSIGPAVLKSKNKINANSMTNIKGLAFSVCFLLSGQVFSAQSTNKPFEDALKSFYMEDLNAAVIHLKNALKNNPKHLPSRILMAEILIAQGNGAAAEVELEFAEQGNADNKRILPLLLEAYLLQNKYDQVINKAIPIVENNRLSSDILVLKGRALFNKNNPTLAFSEYKKALELNLRNADATMGLAQVAYKRNQYDNALEYAEQALKISPLNNNAMQMKASIFQIKGEIEQAISAISGAININAKHFPALLTRAGIYIEQEKFEQALVDVEVILKDIPNEPRANYLKAVISKALGFNEEFSKTASHLDVVLTGMPDDVMKENPIYYYLAGLVNFNQGEYLKAQDDLRDYVDIVSDDIRALKLIAKVELALNEVFSAKNYLVKARLINPEDVEIWSLLGRAYYFTGDFEKAELYFSDVVKSLPNSAGALLDLGELQLNMGQHNNAIDSLIQARELSKNNPAIAFTLAKAYQTIEQPKKALSIIEELTLKDGKSSYLYQQQGILLGLTNQHKKARTSFNQAYLLDENNIEALVHLARMDMIEGNIASARNRLQVKLEKLPDNPMLLVEMGDTYTQKNEIEQARKLYEKAYSLNSSSSLAVSKVLDIYSAQNDFKKAIEIAADFLSRNNEDPQLHLRIANFYILNKSFDNAVNAFQLAVKHSADKSKVLSAYANGQLRMRNRQGAINSLQKAIAWNDDYLAGYMQLINLYAENKNEEKALELIERLSTKINFPALMLKLRGDVALKVEKYAAAEQFFQKSLALDNSQKATFGLSQAYTKQNKGIEAITLLKQWHESQPKNVLMAVALADSYIENGDVGLAAQLYERQLKNSGFLPVLLNNAAQVNITLGNTKLAIKYAEQAFANLPNNVAIMDTMAWAYTKANQPEKALNLFRNALAIESDNAEVKYHLAVNLVMLKRENEAIRYLKEAVESSQTFAEIEQAKQLLAKLLT